MQDHNRLIERYCIPCKRWGWDMVHDQDGKHKAQNGPMGPEWVVIDVHLELSFEIGI